MATYTIGPALCTGVNPNTASQSTQGHEFAGRVIIDETVNTSANTSSISWRFEIYIVRSAYISNYTATSSNYVQVSIDGDVVFSTNNVGTVALNGKYSSNPLVLASGTKTVAHNGDGTKQLSVTAIYTKNLEYMKSITVSGAVDLTTIGRASTITSVTDCNVGGSTTIKWTPHSSSFTYDLRIRIYGGDEVAETAVIVAPGTTSQYTYSYSVQATFANKIPNSTSAQGEVVLITLSDGNAIGEDTKAFTISIPNTSTYNPTASLTVSATSGTAFNSLNLEKRTTFDTTCTVSAKYNATLNYTLTVKNSSNEIVFRSTGTETKTVTTSTFPKAGTYTWTLTVTDSRGRTATATTTKTITAYTPPSVVGAAIRGNNSGSSFVVDETSGTACRITYAATYSNISGNTASVYISDPGGISRVMSTTSGEAIYNGPYSTGAKYNFTVSVYDSVTGVSNAVSTIVTLPMGSFPIDFLPDASGGAIAGIATTSGKMQFGWDIQAKNKQVEILDSSGNTLSKLDTSGLTMYNTSGLEMRKYTLSQTISEGDDLNSYTDIGTYYAYSNARAASLYNCPTIYAFELNIEGITNASSSYIRFYTIVDNLGNMYCRRNYYHDGASHFTAWAKATTDGLDYVNITGSDLDSNGMVNVSTKAGGAWINYVVSAALVKSVTSGGYGLYFWAYDNTSNAYKIIVKRTDGGSITSSDIIKIAYVPIISTSGETIWTTGIDYLGFGMVANTYVSKTNGQLIDYNGWYSTNYLNCNKASRLRFTAMTSTTSLSDANMQYNAFYKADKTFISAFGPTGIGSRSGATCDVNVPVNAAYFRMSGNFNIGEATILRIRPYSG